MTETNRTNVDSIDLSELEDIVDDFQEAEPEQHSFEPVPDGRYQVKVDRVEIDRAKSSGNPLLRWTLKILGPTHQGRLLWLNNVLIRGQSLAWLKRNLRTCGMELEQITDLPSRLGELLDVVLDVKKQSNGENTNIYFNKRLDTGADEANATTDDDDDIAF